MADDGDVAQGRCVGYEFEVGGWNAISLLDHRSGADGSALESSDSTGVHHGGVAA